LIVNYIFWSNLQANGLHDKFGNSINFLRFLFLPFESPISINSFILSLNMYFVPSIIAILLSAYVGWKINNNDKAENLPLSKE